MAGGRPKGSPNKLTAQVREQMSKFAAGISQAELRRLWRTTMKEAPAGALATYVRLCEYFVPRLAHTEVKTDPDSVTVVKLIEKRVDSAPTIIPETDKE